MGAMADPHERPLAPYWFEVEATAYVGASGRTAVRFETQYELLLTNRLILQPLVDLEIYGKSDPEHGIGAGLSTADAGLRLRYEFRREFAPWGSSGMANSLGRRNWPTPQGRNPEALALPQGFDSGSKSRD
jgi:copper resistance protein B